MFISRITRARIGEGCVIPWWMGKAWYEWEKDAKVCIIFPFNHICVWLRSLWLWSRHARRTKWDAKLAGKIRRCRERMHTRAYMMGHDRGWEQGRNFTQQKQESKDGIVADLSTSSDILNLFKAERRIENEKKRGRVQSGWLLRNAHRISCADLANYDLTAEDLKRKYEEDECQENAV